MQESSSIPNLPSPQSAKGLAWGPDEQVFSSELDEETQRLKLLALAMMHDLSVPTSFKKRLRKRLQQVFLGRERSAYGDDDYLRRAVRANEIFFVCDYPGFKALVEDDAHGYL